jgi:hypothetical protein
VSTAEVRTPAWRDHAPDVPDDDAVTETQGSRERKLPAPLSFGQLLRVPDPVERDLANGAVPADAKLLIAAYPKSHKTNVVLELAVSLVSATPFLGRFTVPKPHRVGLMLMEDSEHRIRRRLERICKGHGVEPSSLAEQLFTWFRPPLRLADLDAVRELREYATELELDLLAIDNWSYVSTGDSDDPDVVTPQLSALASVKDARAGMSVLLVHHARKQGRDSGTERLTDIIRNSSAFGAWYDAGYVLARPDEHSPVGVRMEFRDRPAPPAFAFTVEDEFPGDDARMPGGYLRLSASEKTPAALQRETAAERFEPEVVAFLEANPGCSKNQLEKAVKGDRGLIRAAFEHLCATGRARFDAPSGPGKRGRCWLESNTSLDLAETSPQRTPENLADLAAAPVGGERQRTPPTASSEAASELGELGEEVDHDT